MKTRLLSRLVSLGGRPGDGWRAATVAWKVVSIFVWNYGRTRPAMPKLRP
jgi:hypothetical protein